GRGTVQRGTAPQPRAGQTIQLIHGVEQLAAGIVEVAAQAHINKRRVVHVEALPPLRRRRPPRRRFFSAGAVDNSACWVVASPSCIFVQKSASSGSASPLPARSTRK